MRVRPLLIAAVIAIAITAAAAHAAATLTIFTIAGGDAHGFAGDGGPATSAHLNGPAGLAAAANGTVYVADTINQRIRAIDAAGRITTIAGSGGRGFGGDGGPALGATFQDPTAIALAPDGSLYIADSGNSRLRVARPDGTIATVAGTSDQGFSGDDGPAAAAQVNSPAGVVVDPAGRVFFSDTGNQRVREIGTNGRIATIAGNGQTGGAGDGGPATSAQLNTPMGLALQRDGSLLIADAGNNRIRRVAPNGTITTVAGGGPGGDGGLATAAQLDTPVDVAARPDGAFFVVEQGANRVRYVDASGRIATIAGTGAARYGGDGRTSPRSSLNSPQAVELNAVGELLVADSDNNRVRYLTFPGQATRLAIAPLAASVRAHLVKKTVKVKGHKRRVLIVRNVRIPFSLSRAANVRVTIAKRHGRKVAAFAVAAGAGSRAVHLPRRLRSGKHRLTKAHYVLRMTATSTGASATGTLELVVK